MLSTTMILSFPTPKSGFASELDPPRPAPAPEERNTLLVAADASGPVRGIPDELGIANADPDPELPCPGAVAPSPARSLPKLGASESETCLAFSGSFGAFPLTLAAEDPGVPGTDAFAAASAADLNRVVLVPATGGGGGSMRVVCLSFFCPVAVAVVVAVDVRPLTKIGPAHFRGVVTGSPAIPRARWSQRPGLVGGT